MSSTTTPNMSLIVPGAGSEQGPDYALDINADLALVDQHDHSPGKGVQLNSASFNITAALSLNNNPLTSVSYLTFIPQSITPPASSIYESGNDLYFNNGAGLDIQITNASGVAGTPGSIANLVSPASASYVAINRTFVWQSGVGISANLDAASILLRNISPNSTNAITLQAPAGLSSSYDVVLPALPVSQSFMTIDNSGQIAAPAVYPLTGTDIASGTVTGTNIANNTITATNIANATITSTQIASNTIVGGPSGNIAPNTVTGYNIAPGSITRASLTPNTKTQIPITNANYGGSNTLFSGQPFTTGGNPVLFILAPTASHGQMNSSGGQYSINMIVDGTPVGWFVDVSGNGMALNCCVVTLGAGTHSVTLQNDAGSNIFNSTNMCLQIIEVL